MENASKALIIAGAILLAILLISLGIMVYNQAKGTINEADLTTEEVQTFNTKFTTYGGSAVSGTKMNGLMDAVAASNGKSGHTIQVNVTPVGGSTATNYAGNTLPTFDRTNVGTVSFQYDTAGYVNIINIKLTK